MVTVDGKIDKNTKKGDKRQQRERLRESSEGKGEKIVIKNK